MLVFAAAIVLAAIAALVGVRSARTPATPTEPPVTARRELAVVTATPTATPTATLTAPPSASAEPPRVVELDASEAHRTISPPLLIRPKSGVPDAQSSAVPGLNCNPPYTVGPPPDFIRRPKLECLPP